MADSKYIPTLQSTDKNNLVKFKRTIFPVAQSMSTTTKSQV